MSLRCMVFGHEYSESIVMDFDREVIIPSKACGRCGKHKLDRDAYAEKIHSLKSDD